MRDPIQAVCSDSLRFVKQNNIKCIFEVNKGYKDCTDTLKLHNSFPQAEIYCFENNKDTLPLCHANVSKVPKIHLIEKNVPDDLGLQDFINQNQIGIIDILLLDSQGSEPSIIEGLGEKARLINILQTEVKFIDEYKKEPLFMDVKRILKKQGFIFFDFTNKNQYFGTALFINQRVGRNILNIKLKLLGKKIEWVISRRNRIIPKIKSILKING